MEKILVVKPIEGDKVRSSSGLFDPRVFTGGNGLRAVLDPNSTLWGLRYVSSGVRPEELKQKFTSFKKLYEFTQKYLKKRGLEIVEVQDVEDSNFARL